MSRAAARQYFGIAALDAADVRAGEGAGQERILAVALLVASPARVAREVDVQPVHQHRLVVLRVLRDVARLDALRLAGALQQRRIPGGAEPERQRERRRRNRLLRTEAALANELMQALRAAHVGDAEARHRGAGLQAGELLVERHRRQQGVDALLDRQRRVAERRVGWWRRGLLRDERGGQQAARAEDEQGLGGDRLPGHGTHLQGGAQRSTTASRTRLPARLPETRRDTLRETTGEPRGRNC